HGSEKTARENAEHGFIASDALSKNLQTVLVDFIALSLTAKQAHWNIVGTNFRDLHLNLDEVTDIARARSDEIAERMRALHASPDGRPAVIAEQSALPEFPTARSAPTTPSTTWSRRSRRPSPRCAAAMTRSIPLIRRPPTSSTTTSPSSSSRPGSSAPRLAFPSESPPLSKPAAEEVSR